MIPAVFEEVLFSETEALILRGSFSIGEGEF
jgi:hypothetical protein